MKFINCLNKYKYYILLLVFGLLIFTFPMLKSGFDLMPGDGIDQKSINYILEHSFQWLLRAPKHEYFWSAPFYFPYETSIAFSDSLMGIDPIYWVLRIFWQPFSAFQALLAVLCVLNFSTFYYLSRKVFKFSDLASSMGAFIFAFGLLRFFRIVHLNYYSQFYTILALIFLFKINKNNSLIKNNIYMLLAVLSIVAQFYSCYTLGWGFCVIFLTGLIFSLAFAELRFKIFNFFKSFYKLIIIYAVILIIFLIPFAMIYLSVGEVRTIDDVIMYLQNQFCWVRSLSIFDNLFLKDMEYMDFWEKGEMSASSGIITSFIALVGLWFSSKIAKTKGLKWTLYFVLLLVFFMSCTVNTFFMWNFLYDKIPGIQGIRAIVRMAYIGLIVLSFGIAYFIQNFQADKLKNKIILTITILLVLIEQIPYYTDPNSYWITYGWSKSVFKEQIKEEVKQIPDNYDIITFYNNYYQTKQFSTENQTAVRYMIEASLSALAMWCALEKNMYTTNGLSGVNTTSPSLSEYWKIYSKEFKYNLDTFDDRKYFLKNEL